MQTEKEMLSFERQKLHAELCRLRAFMETDDFSALSQDAKDVLSQRARLKMDEHSVLRDRIAAI